MKRGGALETWLTSARPGRCPCGRKLGTRSDAKLCRNSVMTGCRQRYQQLYQEDLHGPSYVREVRGRTLWGDKIRLRLSCSHVELLPPSVADRVGSRRRCRACKEARSAANIAKERKR